jgi:phosphatidylserine/phosphatidylglycerophosphate/cardiolipin synthase-like enzyme
VASRDFPVALTVFAHQSSNASAMLIITAVTVQMHLKSDQIDGKLLRTGAANFSASGRKRQDNDLVVIESAGAAAVSKRAFDARANAFGAPILHA